MAKDRSNRLIHEKSPYLLQHAHNPVDWYPWGSEAFHKAAEEDKPVFLSIGYSTCHWCHVMEKESFEDPQVGSVMNDTFVSIKVDREERPDIDQLYMNVCQMMTGNGGWPLNVVLTPDKKPFFAGTYFPKESRFGRIGILELAARIKEIWKLKRGEVLNSADQITSALKQSYHEPPGGTLGLSSLEATYDELAGRYDDAQGGFSGAPKFPTPHNLLFLLRWWKRTADEKALEMVEETLDAMRQGGIFDHVGLGFHRYATDSEWLVPHFEKMLYDQALLAVAYMEAYQATGNTVYGQTCRDIFSYVLRDMTDPEGGFYSAEDADSEGEEGRFYLWTEKEIRENLSPEEAKLITRAFNVKKEGNFAEEATGARTGRNIFHLKKPTREMAAELRMPEEVLTEQLEKAKEKLFVARERRVHPHKDDKILTDWNGLMIGALAKGARVLNEPAYAQSAVRAVEFIVKKMRRPDGRLLHRYRQGEAAIAAKLDDYAFLVWGLIELFETTQEAKHLQTALDLTEVLLERFWDDKGGGFYFTADDDEELIIRKKEIYDGAIPSGNSIAMLNLLRLALLTGNATLEKKAVEIGQAFSTSIMRSPSAYTHLMVAVDFAVGPKTAVVIAGNSQADDTGAFLAALRDRFLPCAVVLIRPTEQRSPEICRAAEYTAAYASIDGKAAAYVCRDYACNPPSTDVSQVLELLEQRKP